MPRAFIREFRVVGRGDFPMDMLRYDSCWPKDSESASEMHFDFLKGEAAYHAWREQLRLVSLRTVSNQPTPARWQSMGWIVVNEHQFGGMTRKQTLTALGRGA